MIKFFRNIRQTLLKEGKTTNYLKYAIGEIVLVVIGILIALQVNNWNEERKNRGREENILIGLQKEFLSAKEELQADLNARNRYLNASKKLQNLHLNSVHLNVPEDSISQFIINLISTRFYSVGHPILNDLAATGGFELMRNDSVSIALDQYLQEKQRYMAVEDIEGQFNRNQWIPFLSDYIDLSFISKGQMASSDLETTIELIPQKYKFGSLMYIHITRINVSLEYGLRLMNTIDNVLNHLNKELNKK